MEFRSVRIGDDILLKVALGRTDIEATIDPESLLHLVNLGLSSNWHANPNGYVLACAKGGQKVSVARVIMDAGEGEHVEYVDGDPLNLNKSNLVKVRSRKGTKRDRDLLKEEQ